MFRFDSTLLNACQQALRNGISDNDNFISYVIFTCGYTYNVQQLAHILLPFNVVDRAKRDRETFSNVQTILNKASKGSYVLIEKTNAVSQSTYQVIFTYYNGEVCYGGNSDSYQSIPSTDTITRQIISYDIIKCKEYCKQLSIKMKSHQAIGDFHFSNGMQFKIHSFDKPSSVIEIISVDIKKGIINFSEKQKKGKSKYSSMNAYHFSLYVQLANSDHYQEQNSTSNQDSFAFLN